MTTIGIALPHYDGLFPDRSTSGSQRTHAALDVARRAEAAGFDQVWVSDHLWLRLADGIERRSPDCWALLAAIAATTTSVRIGSLVSNASLRAPTMLTHQVMTVLDLARNRLDVGLGAGWNHDELARVGRLVPSTDRLAAVRQAADVLRHAAGDDAPQIWVGGKRSGILQVTAEIADGWNLAWDPTPDQFLARRNQLEALATAAGRPLPRTAVGLTTVIASDEHDLRARWDRLRRWVPGGYLDATVFEDWRARGLIGTVDQVRRRAQQWARLGVDHIVCAFGMPFGLVDDDQLDLARAAFRLDPSPRQLSAAPPP